MEQNKGIVPSACVCTVNSTRMHREDQTSWLTLRFTTPGRLDPCNGPHVPIGGACHSGLPDSKLLTRSAAPHLLLPPGLLSSLTSLRGRHSFVILHQSLSARSPYLTPVILFWARRQQRSFRPTPIALVAHSPHIHIANLHIHTLAWPYTTALRPHAVNTPPHTAPAALILLAHRATICDTP